MPHKIFLKPCEPYNANDSRYDWTLYDMRGMKELGGASARLEELQQILMQNGVESVKAVLVWPGNLAFQTDISLPGKNQRYLQQALAFAVEDRIATDIDRMHFATGKGASKSTVQVHCIEKHLFLGFFDDVLEAAPEIELSASYVDADMLPSEGYEIVISIEGERAMVKSDELSLSLLTKNLTSFLDSVFLTPAEQEGNTHRVKIYDHSGDDSDNKMLIAELQQYPGAEVEIEQVSIPSIELLAESYFHEGSPSIDLCQGDLRIRAGSSHQLRPWYGVAAVLVLAFFIQIGVFVGKGLYYQAQAEDVGQQALAAYSRVVKGSKNVTVDRLARIIKGKLRQSQTTTESVSFMRLLGETGHQYQQRSSRANISFTAITFNAQRGELVMELEAKSFEELDQLKSALVSSGLVAKISSAVQEKNFYRGRLSVSQG